MYRSYKQDKNNVESTKLSSRPPLLVAAVAAVTESLLFPACPRNRIISHRNAKCSFIINFDKSFLTSFFFLFLSSKERELEANKKEKVKEAQLEAEVKLLRKENEALRRHIAVLQAEVYGARLAAKYLDKELAGRHVKSIHVLNMSFSCYCYKTSV